ncbi:pyridoxal phosphate-dependent transferase [Talaromyces proteolyticus]|uniref:Pyridoxal phosphate-dependent transferase n=1 Tax=Talaromyces proteolyticus TaxID=1131652 RepID=A0AAD4Q0B4_9EURO|nr:pyridoxal phosphate-dependent transferase [Talaromyces proteolyticus]KAH8703908.1 pyridoxal phosphate-dependent transferase [Talaromyces proteolyticus]
MSLPKSTTEVPLTEITEAVNQDEERCPSLERRRLIDELVKKLDLPQGYTGLLNIDPMLLGEVKEFVLNNLSKHTNLDASDIVFRVIDIYCVRLYGLFFHSSKSHVIVSHWHHTGLGISRRLAEYLTPHVSDALPFDSYDDTIIIDDHLLQKPTYLLEAPPSLVIKERIISLLKRVPASKAPATSISPIRALTGDRIVPSSSTNDVYLFPTGTAAQYRFHQYLSNSNYHEYSSVAFGKVSRGVLDILRRNGNRDKHFPQGDDKDLLNLEEFCKSEAAADRRVQALYAEFPSASSLISARLENLRKLADKYEFVFVISDLFGSFANVDIMATADVLLTSLTGSFSGYTDVTGGSLVLNADSRAAYRKLKPLMQRSWHNELFAGDAVVLANNSHNYLHRSAILNQNAESVASFLQSKVHDSKTSVMKVNYPKFSEARSSHEMYMRDQTGRLDPGYGWFLTLDLAGADHAVAFYESLRGRFGVHVNTGVVYVALCDETEFEYPYEKGTEDQGRGGNRICIVIGMENIDELVDSFKQALDVADTIKTANKLAI